MQLDAAQESFIEFSKIFRDLFLPQYLVKFPDTPWDNLLYNATMVFQENWQKVLDPLNKSMTKWHKLELLENERIHDNHHRKIQELESELDFKTGLLNQAQEIALKQDVSYLHSEIASYKADNLILRKENEDLKGALKVAEMRVINQKNEAKRWKKQYETIKSWVE